MAENVVINIEANTTGLQQTIDLMVKLGLVTEDNAKKFKTTNDKTIASLNTTANETKKTVDGIGKSLDELSKKNSIAGTFDIVKPAAQAGAAIKTLKEQLSDARREAQLYTEQFGYADDRTKTAVARVSELSQEIDNLNKRVRAVSLEGKFQAIQNFGSAIGGVFTIATGALQAFGVENERATKLAREFQGALNIFQGLAQLAQLSDSFSTVASALGLTKTAATAAAGAMEIEAGATEAAALANEGFAASLSATGIGAIVVLLGSLVAGMVLFGDETDDSAESAQKLKKDIEDVTAAQKQLNAAKLGELDADTALRVARGEITQDEATRIKLQAESLQKYKDATREIILADQKRVKTQQELSKATDEYNRLQQSAADAMASDESGFVSDQKEMDRAKKKVDNLQSAYDKENEIYNKLVETRSITDSNYRKAFEANKITEAKAAESSEKTKQESSKRTAEIDKKNPSIDVDRNKQNYNNALSLIKQYYDEQELLILKSGKTKEQIDNDITDNQIEQLKQQIEAAKLNYQSYTAFEIQLQQLINKRNDIKPSKPLFVGPTIPEYIKNIIEVGNQSKETADKVKKNLKDAFKTEIFNDATKTMNAYFDQWADRTIEMDKMQLDSLDKQSSDLKDSYDKKLMGRIEYENKQQGLDEKRKLLERQIKIDEDRANRQKALFEVLINTASTIMKTAAEVGFVGLPPLLPLIFGIAGAQTAAILAAPLPKYKKGTLSVPGVGTEDTQHALLTPGEAVIPRDTNSMYRDSIAAIYNRKIKPNELNSFVRNKLKGDYSSSSSSGQMVAKMETSDLYALGRMMKNNDGVYIRNVSEFIAAFSSLHNPRR